jgi:hypothetical protein
VASPVRKCREATEAAQTGWLLTRDVSVLQRSCDGVQHALEIVIQFLVFKPDNFDTFPLQIQRSLGFILIQRDGKMVLSIKLDN